MTAPLRHTQASPRRKKSAGKRQFTQANATAVWRVLDELIPMPQTEIAEAVGIAQSAVSEWRSGRRDVTFERFPDLAALYGVDPLVFLAPAEEVEKQVRVHLEAIDKIRQQEVGKALASLATMDRYTKTPVQVPLFHGVETNSRHLRTVKN